MTTSVRVTSRSPWRHTVRKTARMTTLCQEAPVLPTVTDVLELAVVRRGRPQVLAAARALDRPVRWVHAIEQADVTRLLHGGELVLSTGIALPEEPTLLAAYIADLATTGVSGLAVELGRRYQALPDALVAAAEAHGVPLIGVRPAGRAAPVRAGARDVHRPVGGRGAARGDRPAGRAAGRAAGHPGGPVAPGAGLLGRGRRHAHAAGRVRAPGPGGVRPAPDLLPRGRRLAGDHGRGRRRGLGPGHPGDERAAGAAGLRADRADGHRAGPGAAADPAAGEPGAAGPSHADQRDRGERARRPGGGGGPGAGRGGGRP